ncbi:hypothetical protein BD01_0944 [Thermococcus nautili]|uniref:Uncharacterized protein n=1 Tax=Thermococcus nautili TaxID=195522 RepID=W8NTG8_9EURY|nr:hypothetical protein BD01_0944 [Thermococcus nautili]
MVAAANPVATTKSPNSKATNFFIMRTLLPGIMSFRAIIVMSSRYLSLT